jgi:hypothetical protein
LFVIDLQKSEKTRTKSFRLDVTLVEKISQAAKRAHMTENAFVCAVLEDRVIIDPVIPAFHMIRLSSGVFQSILGTANTDALETGASDTAQRNFPLILELYAASGRILDFREFIIEIMGKSCHWFEVEGDDNRTHRGITLRHIYGLKWSKYVKAYILTAYSIISRDKIKIEITDQFIRIEFPVS